MRKQVKPVSGRINTQTLNQTRPNSLQTQFQTATNLNTTFLIETITPAVPETPPPILQDPSRFGSPSKSLRSPAVSKKAKQKWEILERKVFFIFIFLFIKVFLRISKNVLSININRINN